MSEQAPGRSVGFRPVVPSDFPLMTGWLNQPHVRRFYQKAPIVLDEVAAEYAAAVAGKEPTLCHLAVAQGRPIGYLQSYRNLDYAEWAAMVGLREGTSVDLYLGEPAFLGRGWGCAMLRAYLEQVVFPAWPEESLTYIAHELENEAALRCSVAAGYRPLRIFVEDGDLTQLLVRNRSA